MNLSNPFSENVQADLDAIRRAARISDYFYDQVRFLCNNIGPRLSGSAQAAAAVEYVATQMRNLGFQVRLEPVTVTHWVRGIEEAQITSYPGQASEIYQKILVTALGNSVPTPPEGISAAVLVVDTFEQLNRARANDVEGKVVLYNYAFDEFGARAGAYEHAYRASAQYRVHGPVQAAKRGATATLVRSVGPKGFRLAHTGVTLYEEDVPQIAAGAIPAEDSELIADLAKRGEVVIRLVLTPRDLPSTQSYNVIADLKGSDLPEQVVIVSGHLDSWDLGTGALDDASGVAVAMDVMRVIRQINPRPRRTIRFVAWMNEENGVAGGRAYAANHQSELPDHIAAIELDYGDGRPLGLKVHATVDKMITLSATLKAIANPIGGVINVNVSPGVDLTPMSRAGVPTMSPMQEARNYFNYHHTQADTFDKVRPEELRREVEFIAPLVYALAQFEPDTREIALAG